jgi:hypothetical protein
MEEWNDGKMEKWNYSRFKVKLLTSDCLLPTANWRLPSFFCALRFALCAMPGQNKWKKSSRF